MMTGTNKTHYRAAFDSPYLSSADVAQPTVLTIDRVMLEPDKSKRTKDKFNTAYFAERTINDFPLKPMILNATNSKFLADKFGSKFIDDWTGRVMVYVQEGVRFGKDTVEGLRLMDEPALIAPHEASEITALIEQTKSDLALFLGYIGADSVDTIRTDQLYKAKTSLERKLSA